MARLSLKQSVFPASGARLFRRLGLFVVMAAVLGVLLTGCAGTTAAPTAAPTAAAQPTKAAAAPTQALTAAPTAASAAATKAAPAATSAPAAAPTAASQPTAATKTVSFAKDVLPIFQQNCVQCHGGQFPQAGLVLNAYAGVMKGSGNGAVIKPGDSKNSFLVQQIVNGKMPQRSPKLAQALIDTIAAWVDAGAPNN